MSFFSCLACLFVVFLLTKSWSQQSCHNDCNIYIFACSYLYMKLFLAILFYLLLLNLSFRLCLS